jgi:tripartite-type tricarboxylate transporter receptor subunit TctC
MKRRQLITAAALSAAAFTATNTWAQSGPYPNRPIKMIVPYPAGISPDIVARLIGEN